MIAKKIHDPLQAIVAGASVWAVASSLDEEQIKQVWSKDTLEILAQNVQVQYLDFLAKISGTIL